MLVRLTCMSTDAPTPNTSASTSPAKLPEDLTVCHDMIRELLDTLKSTRRENEQLHHRLDQLLRKLFGPRAERYDPNQPLLFAELAVLYPAVIALLAEYCRSVIRSADVCCTDNLGNRPW